MRLIAPAVALAALVVATAVPLQAATITLVNHDGPGEGFNDPTPVAPVGGNPGTTLGQQRLIAFQYAADIWGAVLYSDVEILVAASFDPLSCSASSATLGGAGPETVHRDFANAPEPDTWYTQAQANSHAGFDLDPTIEDIFAIFNSTLGTSCSFPRAWYYGLNQSPPGSDIDLVSVALHEIGHGLGFLTLVGLNNGVKFGGWDDAYMLHLENHASGLHYSAMTNGQRAAANVATGDLHWTGASVVAAAASLTTGRDPISGHVEIYAPNPTEGGSSVSHFSDALFPNELMEPFYTGAKHNLGLALYLMYDLGWVPGACGDGILDVDEQCDDGNTIGLDGCSACKIDTCWACVGEPSVCAPQDGDPCDDGQACTTVDTCQAGVCVGAAAPLVGCATTAIPGKGSLVMKDNASNRKDQMIWKFLRGGATSLAALGNPTAATSYRMCVFDRTGDTDTVLMSLDMPAGIDWTANATGYKYKSRTGFPSGVRNVLLKSGTTGKTKIIIKAKGVPLGMTNLGVLDLPLTVQLSNGTQCWESTFSGAGVQRNTPQLFKARPQ